MVQIGGCPGCLKSTRLSDGACDSCISKLRLDTPEKRERWVRVAHRVRLEPRIASQVYSQIMDMRARELFIEMFGLPPGQEAPEKEEAPQPKLRLVK